MKPGIPQGTRDFGPETVRKRNYIFQSIRSVFELYGFQPLETPAMENLETLMGKYGEEGDKLIFKILNNGLDNPSKQDTARNDFESVLSGKNVKGITERALRYDLTIPFARYVAMNQSQLSFPFKRYQIQPVWRADRPQKGRYREFYQCDADVVGSKSLLNELDLVNIYHQVFVNLGLKDYELKINSRKILSALATLCGGQDKMMDITMAIDKLDKIGMDKVKEELLQRGISEEQVNVIEQYLLIDGDNFTKLQTISALLGDIEEGKQGIEELNYVITNIQKLKGSNHKTVGSIQPAKGSGESSNLINSNTNGDHQLENEESPINLTIDFTLARGLNYYTGIIFEAKAPSSVKMGSIGGGGRYDDLTGLFGVPNIAGVGISFGVDRIYDVLEELNLFPESIVTSSQVLFFNLGEAESFAANQLAQQLRANGISCELYHESSKFDKQFKYAEKKNIPFIAILGSKELEEKSIIVKELATGKQESIQWSELISFLHK